MQENNFIVPVQQNPLTSVNNDNIVLDAIELLELSCALSVQSDAFQPLALLLNNLPYDFVVKFKEQNKTINSWNFNSILKEAFLKICQYEILEKTIDEAPTGTTQEIRQNMNEILKNFDINIDENDDQTKFLSDRFEYFAKNIADIYSLQNVRIFKDFFGFVINPTDNSIDNLQNYILDIIGNQIKTTNCLEAFGKFLDILERQNKNSFTLPFALNYNKNYLEKPCIFSYIMFDNALHEKLVSNEFTNEKKVDLIDKIFNVVKTMDTRFIALNSISLYLDVTDITVYPRDVIQAFANNFYRLSKYAYVKRDFIGEFDRELFESATAKFQEAGINTVLNANGEELNFDTAINDIRSDILAEQENRRIIDAQQNNIEIQARNIRTQQEDNEEENVDIARQENPIRHIDKREVEKIQKELAKAARRLTKRHTDIEELYEVFATSRILFDNRNNFIARIINRRESRRREVQIERLNNERNWIKEEMDKIQQIFAKTEQDIDDAKKSLKDLKMRMRVKKRTNIQIKLPDNKVTVFTIRI